MAHQAFSAPLAGLTNASTDETKSAEVPLNSLSQVGGNAIWGAGCVSGQVVFEVAPSNGYAGAWHVLFTADSQDNGTESFTYPGPFDGFGRWRVNTVVAGGTVSTTTTGMIG
jgi:hypothetical protein